MMPVLRRLLADAGGRAGSWNCSNLAQTEGDGKAGGIKPAVREEISLEIR
jgi:hypothetical protein